MMPRGDPTRAVTVRIPEKMAVEVEEYAKRAGRTLTTELQGRLAGLIRYPGKMYTWAESGERAKLLRRVEELSDAHKALTELVKRHDPAFTGLTSGRKPIPEDRESPGWFEEMKETHAGLNEQVRRRRAQGGLGTEGLPE